MQPINQLRTFDLCTDLGASLQSYGLLDVEWVVKNVAQERNDRVAIRLERGVGGVRRGPTSNAVFHDYVPVLFLCFTRTEFSASPYLIYTKTNTVADVSVTFDVGDT